MANNKRHVTYNEALQLKELGFNGAVDSFYVIGRDDMEDPLHMVVTDELLDEVEKRDVPATFQMLATKFNETADKLAAPSIDLAIDWLENKLNVHVNIIWVKATNSFKYEFYTEDPFSMGSGFHNETRNDAKHKALSAILYVLTPKTKK